MKLHVIQKRGDRGGQGRPRPDTRREPDPADRRFTSATLLAAAMRKMKSAAPGHVAWVRHLVIDNLSDERLRRLGQDAECIVRRIDSPAR